MATNPMQRKARNSFLLGMLLMLIICGLVIAFLFLQLKNYQDKGKCLTKIYYDTKYDEYVVIPQKKRCVHLESGQPLGVGRVYYLPRAMKIVIKNEQGQNENMFRLA